jgi:hypothetical protein
LGCSSPTNEDFSSAEDEQTRSRQDQGPHLAGNKQANNDHPVNLPWAIKTAWKKVALEPALQPIQSSHGMKLDTCWASSPPRMQPKEATFVAAAPVHLFATKACMQMSKIFDPHEKNLWPSPSISFRLHHLTPFLPSSLDAPHNKE